MRINSFSVRGYKNFTERVVLGGLADVNVIYGDNNVGKSNLLEAMFLFFRLLSRDFCGDRLPLQRPSPVLRDVFEEKTGFQLDDCFNYVKRTPIELRAEIDISPEDVAETDVGPLSGPSPVTAELVLSLTSHSPAFEGPNPFYAMRLHDGHPVVERRTGSREFLGLDAGARPAGARGSLCSVTSDGLVQVPESIREGLGLLGGGAVSFVPRKDGHVEMLADAQMLEFLSPEDS